MLTWLEYTWLGAGLDSRRRDMAVDSDGAADEATPAVRLLNGFAAHAGRLTS